MSVSSPQEITQLLLAWRHGDQTALDQLMPLVYEELRRLAHHFMGHERPGHLLQTTALVNEAYLRLIDSSRVQWESRAHFLAVAGQLMRRVLVDAARERQSRKRGGEWVEVSLAEAVVVPERRGADFIALDDALDALAAMDQRKSEIVVMRFFGGLSVEETAAVLKVSPDTVMRDWGLAKVWLYRELSKNEKRVMSDQ
jgi:RNA polymerase sigma-70 factor (ECF subfamily)